MAIGIIAANVVVFLGWRVPALQSTMVRYFCSNPTKKNMCLPMLLSTFSHYSAWHLAANMYVLYSFSTAAVMVMGREQFMAFYLSAGVTSSFASYIHKMAVGRGVSSLGASGAIMGMLGLVCTQFPNTHLAILFLPMFTFTAGSAIKVLVAADTAGILFGWRLFDHAAHLGGALLGIAYCKWGHEYIWSKREPLVRMWHEIRGR